MNYFTDITFLSGEIQPECRANLNRRLSEFYTIEFLLSGELAFQAGDRPPVLITQPAVFWQNMTTTYRYHPPEGKSWYNHWFSIRGPRADRLMDKGFMAITDKCFRYVSGPMRYQDIFTRIIENIKQNNPRKHPENLILTEQLLYMLMEEMHTDQQQDPAAVEIRQLAKRMRSNPWEEYDFKHIAAGLNTSYSSFRRRFRTTIGRPPYEFLLTCSMRKAADAIASGSRQIKEVAYNAGYDDPAQFSKMFRNKIGMSPLEFKTLTCG